MVQERAAGTEVGSGKKRRTGRPSGADIQEVEWQFDADDLEVVEEWLEEYDSGSGFSVSPGSKAELTDTYLDTEDWRLYRAGYALRVRRKGSNKTSEATMKSLASDGSGGKVRRREISERVRNGDGGFPDLSKARGQVGERLRALTGSHEVRRLFEIRTHRRNFNLRLEAQEDSVESGTDGSSGEIVQDASGNVRRSGDGPRIAEISLDDTTIRLDDGGEPARLSRVEVEVEEEAPDEVSEFVEEMRRSLELEPTTTSKYEAGLYAADLSPDGDPDLGPDGADASMSAGEVAFAILRRQFAAMLTHEPGTRLGEDPEELHDMRVATRRMRAALKLFSGALPEQASFYRNELKWVAGVLGEVRDLDVQIEHLEELSSEQEEDREAFGEVVGALEKRRAEPRERMLEALDSDRYDRFVSSFAAMLRRGPEGEERGEDDVANEPIVAVAPNLVSRRYKKWRKTGKGLSEESSPEAYHEFRKEGKRLRYALEFLKDVYGEKPTAGLVKPLKELQDGLGRHQDLIVAAELLENVAADARRLSLRTAFAMGALSERHLQEAAALRSSLPRSKPYRALMKGKKWEGFEKAMEKRRRSVEKAQAKKAGKKKTKK